MSDLQTGLGKAFLVKRALVWKDVKACRRVSYDGGAQKAQVRPEPVVMLRNCISVLENDQWFKQRMVSLDLLYRKLTLEKSTNGAVRS